MANKGASALVALSLLGNTVRGMTSANLRILYLGCVIPILMWGAELWFSGPGDGGHLSKLETVEYKGLLKVTGAWNSSPRVNLAVLTNCMPIAQVLPYQQAQFTCQQHMGSLHPLMETQPDLAEVIPESSPNLRRWLALALPANTELVQATQFPPPS